VVYLLCFLKIEGENKNLKLDKFSDIPVNFEGKKIVDHILEIPRLVFFGVECLNVILQNHVYEVIPLGTKTI